MEYCFEIPADSMDSLLDICNELFGKYGWIVTYSFDNRRYVAWVNADIVGNEKICLALLKFDRI